MIKTILKLLIPPIFLKLKLILNKNNISSFYGDFASWEEVNLLMEDNYKSSEIHDRVKQASLKVKSGEALFERDARCFYEKSYRYPVLALLLSIGIANQEKLSVLDFGGSLGSFYNQHKAFFVNLQEIKWNIVEQERYVKTGIEEFQNDKLKFYYTIKDCLDENDVDLVLFSSVLQYLESPYKILEEIFQYSPKSIIIDRIAFSDEEERDRLTVHKIPKIIYPNSLPCWFFSKQKFIKIMNENSYDLKVEFECDDEPSKIGKFQGLFFQKKDS